MRLPPFLWPALQASSSVFTNRNRRNRHRPKIFAVAGSGALRTYAEARTWPGPSSAAGAWGGGASPPPWAAVFVLRPPGAGGAGQTATTPRRPPARSGGAHAARAPPAPAPGPP